MQTRSMDGLASKENIVKKDFPRKTTLLLAFSAMACGACASSGRSEFNPPRSSGNSSSLASGPVFGDDFSVRQAIGTVKDRGTRSRVSSHAIRLPERPLGAVTVFSFEYPANCGGHTFRVIEADGAQILEFDHPESAGGSNQVRDYVSGPNPFVQPGLWTAYDHTAASINTMTSQFEQRGAGMFNGVYSQGLVTNLPVAEKWALGSAYRQALSDARSCDDTKTLLGAVPK